MPTEKLTLSIETTAIANGKRYAAETGRSLSSIVSDYLESLTHGNGEHHPLSTEVTLLLGIGAGTTAPADSTAYLRHLEEKYL